MIGIEIGLNRVGGPSSPALDITTPVSVAWSAGTVTITPPVTTPAFTSISYAALVDGVAVTVTGTTFPAAQGAAPKSVQVTASMTRADYRTTISTAYVDVPAAPAIGFTVSPTITGSAAYGATRGLAFTTFGSPAPTATYQWFLDGEPVPGATASTFSGGFPDQEEQCDVTLANGLAAPVTLRTPPVRITHDAPIIAPAIGGFEVLYLPTVPTPILTPAVGGFVVSY